MPRVLVGIGSNLGDCERSLQSATHRLQQESTWHCQSISAFIRTSPIGGPDGQPDFHNGAVVLETELAPRAVLDKLRSLEHSLGRKRPARWAPRTLDLDLLLYDNLVLEDTDLAVPHPWMGVRSFVLQPAAQIASAMVHPRINRTVGELWHQIRRTNGAVAFAVSTPYSSPRQVLADVIERAARESGWTSTANWPENRSWEPWVFGQSGPKFPQCLESVQPDYDNLTIVTQCPGDPPRSLRAWIGLREARDESRGTEADGDLRDAKMMLPPLPAVCLRFGSHDELDSLVRIALGSIACVS